MLRRIISLVLTFGLLFQQIGFAQVAAELNLASYLSGLNSSLNQDKFRPLHLRYFSYDALNDNFKVLLDKGDIKNLEPTQAQEATQTLLNYFLVGISLPDDSLWVNLRPDSEKEIIDSYLEKTDIGKIMLEADLQLKKDTASFTSPSTPEGKKYWDKLYKKAAEIYSATNSGGPANLFGGGTENVSIPTLTRPWIVPGEIIVRETKESAYVYKATLKVMLEQDYLKDSATYNFKDPRQKALNEYSSQLIRELIIPKLTKEVNSSKRYANLRQVYYSLILSRWFKMRFSGTNTTYGSLINTQNLTNLTSQQPWSKTTYFKQYQQSFAKGEYNIKEPVYTPTSAFGGGQVIRSYFSGGIQMGSSAIRTDGFSGKEIPAALLTQPGALLINGNSGTTGLETSVAASPVNLAHKSQSPQEMLKMQRQIAEIFSNRFVEQFGLTPNLRNKSNFEEWAVIFVNRFTERVSNPSPAAFEVFLEDISREIDVTLETYFNIALEKTLKIIKGKLSELKGENIEDIKFWLNAWLTYLFNIVNSPEINFKHGDAIVAIKGCSKYFNLLSQKGITAEEDAKEILNAITEALTKDEAIIRMGYTAGDKAKKFIDIIGNRVLGERRIKDIIRDSRGDKKLLGGLSQILEDGLKGATAAASPVNAETIQIAVDAYWNQWLIGDEHSFKRIVTELVRDYTMFFSKLPSGEYVRGFLDWYLRQNPSILSIPKIEIEEKIGDILDAIEQFRTQWDSDAAASPLTDTERAVNSWWNKLGNDTGQEYNFKRIVRELAVDYKALFGELPSEEYVGEFLKWYLYQNPSILSVSQREIEEQIDDILNAIDEFKKKWNPDAAASPVVNNQVTFDPAIIVEDLIKEVQTGEVPPWMARDYQPGRVFVHKEVERGRELDSIAGRIAEARKTLNKATYDSNIRKRVEEALALLGKHPQATKLTLAQFTGVALRLVRQLTGNNDPWSDYKRILDEAAKPVYEEIRKKVTSIAEEKGHEVAIRAALLYATIANLLDVTNPEALANIATSLGLQPEEITSAYLERIMEEVFERVSKDKLIIDELQNFLTVIKEGESVLYWLDNHGEVIFDQLPIEQFILAGYNVAVVGRGEPVQEDVTAYEAFNLFRANEYLNPYLSNGKLMVVSDGSYFLGADLRQSASYPEFLKAWRQAVGRVVKGGGAFQTDAGEKFSIHTLFARMMKKSETGFQWLADHRGLNIPEDRRTDIDALFMYQPASFEKTAASPVSQEAGKFAGKVAKLATFQGIKAAKMTSFLLESVKAPELISRLAQLSQLSTEKLETKLEGIPGAETLLSRFRLSQIDLNKTEIDEGDETTLEQPDITRLAKEYQQLCGLEVSLMQQVNFVSKREKKILDEHYAITRQRMAKMDSMHDYAPNPAEFLNYRGKAREYYNRVFLTDTAPRMEDFVDTHFTNKGRELRFIVKVGIGANEEYDHHARAVYTETKTGKIVYVVINNSYEFEQFRKRHPDANGENTLMIYESRSGETEEPLKVFLFNYKKFPVSIVFSNQGPLYKTAENWIKKQKQRGEIPTILRLDFRTGMAGRYMRRKTPMSYCALHLLREIPLKPESRITHSFLVRDIARSMEQMRQTKKKIEDAEKEIIELKQKSGRVKDQDSTKVSERIVELTDLVKQGNIDIADAEGEIVRLGDVLEESYSGRWAYQYMLVTDKADRQLAFTKQGESLAIQISEFIHRNQMLDRQVKGGRDQIALIVNDKEILWPFTEQPIQNVMEGVNKPGNKLIMSRYLFSEEPDAIEAILAQADSHIAFFVLNRQDPSYNAAINKAMEMHRRKMVPVIILEIDGPTIENTAGLSTLIEDTVVYYAGIIGQDPYTNPEVKYVREESDKRLVVIANEKWKRLNQPPILQEEKEEKVLQEVQVSPQDPALISFVSIFDRIAEALNITPAQVIIIFEEKLDGELAVNAFAEANGVHRQVAVDGIKKAKVFPRVVSDYEEAMRRKEEMQRSKADKSAFIDESRIKEQAKELGIEGIEFSLGPSDIPVDMAEVRRLQEIYTQLRGTRGTEDSLAKRLAEYIHLSISLLLRDGKQRSNIVLTTNDQYNLHPADEFKKSWARYVSSKTKVMADIGILPRASHLTIEGWLGQADSYFTVALLAESLGLSEEDVLSAEDVEFSNPAHQGLDRNEALFGLTLGNRDTMLAKMPGIAIRVKQITPETDQMLVDLFRDVSDHYAKILVNVPAASSAVSDVSGLVTLKQGDPGTKWWEEAARKELRQNPVPWGDDPIVAVDTQPGVMRVRLTREMLADYDEIKNPSGRQIERTFAKEEQIGPTAIAGIRHRMNIDNIHDTRQVKNSVERLLTSISLALMIKILYNKGAGFPYQANYGHEVRYHSNILQAIMVRSLAAFGFITHVIPNNEATAIWNTSTMGKFFNLVLSLCGTSSHSPSDIDGLKIMDYEGSQFLIKPILAMLAIKRAIIEKIKKDGYLDFYLASEDDPRITDQLYRTTDNGMYVYKKYQAAAAADEFILGLVTSLDSKRIHIDCAHGSAYRTLTAFFKEMGLERLNKEIDWMHAEERPDFANIGKLQEQIDTGKEMLFDLGADVTQVKAKVIDNEVVNYFPVLTTADYPQRFKGMPIGDITLHTDMDNDRLAVSQIMPNTEEVKALLKRIGVVYNVIDAERVLAVFIPNKFFHMLHEMNFRRITHLMEKGLVDKNRTLVVLTTLASTRAVSEWAEARRKEGYKVVVVNTAVGYAKLANVMYRAEGFMRTNPGEDVIITDARGIDVNLGPDPLIIAAWEESGGIITGITFDFRDLLGNTFLAEREKSATESIFLSLALISQLQKGNAWGYTGEVSLSKYLEYLYQRDEVKTPIDLRYDYELGKPGTPEEQEGNVRKMRIFGAYLAIAINYMRHRNEPAERQRLLEEAKIILKDIFNDEFTARISSGDDRLHLNEVLLRRFNGTRALLDSLSDIWFTGDGVMFVFRQGESEMLILFRPSGTEPKLKAYGFGSEPEKIAENAWAFAYGANIKGTLPESFTSKKYLMELWGTNGSKTVDKAMRMQNAWEQFGLVVDPEDLSQDEISTLKKRELVRTFNPPDDHLQRINSWLKAEGLPELQIDLSRPQAMPQEKIVELLDAIPESVYKDLGRTKAEVLRKETSSPAVASVSFSLHATLDDVDVKGKTALVRPDINVQTKEGHIKAPENQRIIDSAKTIKELAEKGAKVVVIFHQGRPGDPDFMDTPFEHAQQLAKAVGRYVKVVDDLFGPKAVSMIKGLENGEILVLKPVRAKDPSSPEGDTLEKNKQFVKTLEPLVDFFVLDGFSVAHRATPSVTGFEGVPAVAGRSMDYEVKEALEVIDNLVEPCLLVVGGGKATEKFMEMGRLRTGKVDKAIIGGRLANLAIIAAVPEAAEAKTDDALYNLAVEAVGQATADDLKNEKLLALIPELAGLIVDYRDKIELPTDMVYLDESGQRAVIKLVNGRRVPQGFNRLLRGIGPATARHYAEVASRSEASFQSAMVVGPLSDTRYPVFEQETKQVIEQVSKIGFWAVAGDDTGVLLKKLGFTPHKKVSGGGAFSEMFADKYLPGIKFLVDNHPDKIKGKGESVSSAVYQSPGELKSILDVLDYTLGKVIFDSGLDKPHKREIYYSSRWRIEMQYNPASGMTWVILRDSNGNDKQVIRYRGSDALAKPEAAIRADLRKEVQKKLGLSSTSPSIHETGSRAGGIDFRALPMNIQPMGSFSGLNFNLPQLSRKALEQMNIDAEMQQLKNMVSSGICPSGERIKELIAACAQKGKMDSYVDNLLFCLVDICKLQEENADESSPELKEALAIIDAQS